MKRTVRYREVDGKRIVIGFGVVMIDPMESRQRAIRTLKNDKLTKDLETAFGEMRESNSFDAVFKVAAFRKRYEEKLHETALNNPVYLRMVNEHEVSDAEFQKLFDLTQQHPYVAIDGIVLERGEEGWL